VVNGLSLPVRPGIKVCILQKKNGPVRKVNPGDGMATVRKGEPNKGKSVMKARSEKRNHSCVERSNVCANEKQNQSGISVNWKGFK